MKSVVLVHGFWHGTWCWSPVAVGLAARGIPSVAVDLEGHGLRAGSPSSRWSRPFDGAAYATETSPQAAVTPSSAAAALVQQLRRIGAGEPCVLVAHSMGGAVATAAVELAPELVGHLVYVAAFAPVAGIPPAAYLGEPEMAGEGVSARLRADPTAVGALRFDTGDAAERAALAEVFYADVDPALAAAATDLLNPDAPAALFVEPPAVTPERFGSVPRSYVLCTQDRAIPAPMQHRFVRELDAACATPTAVTELDSSHSPFLSQPDALVEALATAWAATLDPA